MKKPEQQEIFEKHIKNASREIQLAMRVISTLKISSTEKRKFLRKVRPLFDLSSNLKLSFPNLEVQEETPKKKVKEVKDVNRRR